MCRKEADGNPEQAPLAAVEGVAPKQQERPPPPSRRRGRETSSAGRSEAPCPNRGKAPLFSGGVNIPERPLRQD